METLDRWLRSGAQVLAGLSAVVVIVVMFGMATDVTVRNVSGGSVPGLYELVQSLTVLILAFGITEAETERVNPRVTLLTDRMSPRAASITRTVGFSVVVILGIWLAFGSIREAIASTLHAEVVQGLVRYPVWPTKILLAVGLTVFALWAVNSIVLRISSLARGKLPAVDIENTEAIHDY